MDLLHISQTTVAMQTTGMTNPLSYISGIATSIKFLTRSLPASQFVSLFCIVIVLSKYAKTLQDIPVCDLDIEADQIWITSNRVNKL